MKIRLAIIASLATFLALGSGWALAKNAGKKKTADDGVHALLPPSEAVFTEEERVLVRNWFSYHRSGLPPGLAKRDRLPPGLEKHLRKNGTLPPGLQKKIHPLPFELERQLRRLPTGYRRVVIAGNVILMNQRTALIYDIIRDTIPYQPAASPPSRVQPTLRASEPAASPTEASKSAALGCVAFDCHHDLRPNR
jgi:hypothetical protein